MSTHLSRVQETNPMLATLASDAADEVERRRGTTTSPFIVAEVSSQYGVPTPYILDELERRARGRQEASVERSTSEAARVALVDMREAMERYLAAYGYHAVVFGQVRVDVPRAGTQDGEHEFVVPFTAERRTL